MILRFNKKKIIIHFRHILKEKWPCCRHVAYCISTSQVLRSTQVTLRLYYFILISWGKTQFMKILTICCFLYALQLPEWLHIKTLSTSWPLSQWLQKLHYPLRSAPSLCSSVVKGWNFLWWRLCSDCDVFELWAVSFSQLSQVSTYCNLPFKYWNSRSTRTLLELCFLPFE